MFFKDLETDRLFLKNIAHDDRDFIFMHFTNSAVTAYLFDADPMVDMHGADEIISFYVRPEPRGVHRWVLVRKTDNAKMGTCGFHLWDRNKGTVEVGYDLSPAYWGHGYMREAMQAILGFAGENMTVKEINAVIYVENRPSLALAEKLGFAFAGETKDEVFQDKHYPHHVYTFHPQDE